MLTPKRRIKSASVKLLSLCKHPANRLPVLYKADGSVEFQTLTKIDPVAIERGELLALGYSPELTDAQGDIAGPQAVVSMAHSHMKAGGGLDIQHDGKPVSKDQAYLAESFIVQKGDPRFDGWKDMSGGAIDATGSWGVLIKIDDPQIRESYKSGKLDGVSLFGTAEVEDVDADAATVARIVEATVKALQGPKEIEVDSKEMTAILAANNAALIEGLTKALKPAEPVKTEPAKPEDGAPVLKAEDRADPAKVKAFQRALKIHELQKATVWTDQKSIDTYMAELAKIQSEDAPAPEKSEELKAAEAEVARLRKSSSQPLDPAKPALQGEAKLVKSGLDAAEWINNQRGFAPSK